MTHPVTPPPELVAQWTEKAKYWEGSYEIDIATRAAQWGADQELEACCVELSKNTLNGAFYVGKEGCPSWHHFALKVIDKLRAARRPKPMSLKKLALLQLDVLNADLFERGLGRDLSQIRRALEQLDD